WPLRLQHISRRETFAQNWSGGPTEPLCQEGRIDRAKVELEFQIAISQIVEARMLADQAGLHTATDQKNRRGRTMVGTSASIFLDSPSELTEDERHYSIELAMGLQILRKGRQCPAKLLQQHGMSRGLIRMRIKSIEGHIIDSRAQSSVNQLGDTLQLFGQRRSRISHRRSIGLGGSFDPAAYIQSRCRASLHKLEELIVCAARQANCGLNRA